MATQNQCLPFYSTQKELEKTLEQSTSSLIENIKKSQEQLLISSFSAQPTAQAHLMQTTAKTLNDLKSLSFIIYENEIKNPLVPDLLSKNITTLKKIRRLCHKLKDFRITKNVEGSFSPTKFAVLKVQYTNNVRLFSTLFNELLSTLNEDPSISYFESNQKLASLFITSSDAVTPLDKIPSDSLSFFKKWKQNISGIRYISGDRLNKNIFVVGLVKTGPILVNQSTRIADGLTDISLFLKGRVGKFGLFDKQTQSITHTMGRVIDVQYIESLGFLRFKVFDFKSKTIVNLDTHSEVFTESGKLDDDRDSVKKTSYSINFEAVLPFNNEFNPFKNYSGLQQFKIFQLDLLENFKLIKEFSGLVIEHDLHFVKIQRKDGSVITLEVNSDQSIILATPK